MEQKAGQGPTLTEMLYMNVERWSVSTLLQSIAAAAARSHDNVWVGSPLIHRVLYFVGTNEIEDTSALISRCK